jgi:hypothetical protein
MARVNGVGGGLSEVRECWCWCGEVVRQGWRNGNTLFWTACIAKFEKGEIILAQVMDSLWKRSTQAATALCEHNLFAQDRHGSEGTI